MSEVTIGGYVPGAIGRVAELQALYYSKAWASGWPRRPRGRNGENR